jgi:tRNA 2-thiouridine synthesizing protein A
VSDALRAASVDAEWDAGELGCGELVVELRARMLALPPGCVLRLIALDAGASADIPAWCRLTGHALLDHAPPVYLIRRKES